jgi:hypothetical protein
MHGGDIKIVELSPDIRRVFDVMGASRIFDIHPGVDEARTAFLALSAAAESEESVTPVPTPGPLA